MRVYGEPFAVRTTLGNWEVGKQGVQKIEQTEGYVTIFKAVAKGGEIALEGRVVPMHAVEAIHYAATDTKEPF